MPRRSIDQAIATGVVGSTQYGLVLTTDSVAAELARMVSVAFGLPVRAGSP